MHSATAFIGIMRHRHGGRAGAIGRRRIGFISGDSRGVADDFAFGKRCCDTDRDREGDIRATVHVADSASHVLADRGASGARIRGKIRQSCWQRVRNRNAARVRWPDIIDEQRVAERSAGQDWVGRSGFRNLQVSLTADGDRHTATVIVRRRIVFVQSYIRGIAERVPVAVVRATRTPIWRVALVFAVTLPTLHVTTWPAAVQPLLDPAETKLSSAGNVSVTVTPLASEIPRLSILNE